VIKVYEVSHEDGQFQIALPGYGVALGQGLNKVPAYKDMLQPLAASISADNVGLVKAAFEDLAQALRHDIQRAEALKARLERLREEHSRWAISFYLANYGETAALILPNATVEVRRGRFEGALRQPCRLVQVGSRDGQDFNRDAPEGTLVAPSSDARGMFITSQLQRDMKDGNELRGRFRDGTSQVRVVFHCITAGFPARKRISTRWTAFAATAPAAT